MRRLSLILLAAASLSLGAAPVPAARPRPVRHHEVTGRWELHMGAFVCEALLSSDGSYFSFQNGEVWLGEWHLGADGALHITEWPLFRPHDRHGWTYDLERRGRNLVGGGSGKATKLE